MFYNLCIIISAVVFSSIGGNDGGPGSIGIVGLGVGALAGAILQFLISLLGFIGLRYKYKVTIQWRNNNFREILKQLPPRSLDQGIDNVNSVVETNLATRLGPGKLSYYENAYVLQSAPTLLIGTTISTAAFPRLSDRLSQGRPDLFRRDFLNVLRVLIWIIMPIVVVSYFLRGYLARLIFANDAPQIALIFGFFAGAILFRTIYALVSRWFYAQKDSKTPLYISIFAIALNIILAYILSRPWNYDIAGLAMAQSIVAGAEVVILFGIMVWRDHKLINRDFWVGIYRILSITGFAVIVAYLMIRLFPLSSSDVGIVTLGSKLIFIVTPTFLVYFVMSLLFGLEEPKPFVKKLKELIFKPVKIQ